MFDISRQGEPSSELHKHVHIRVVHVLHATVSLGLAETMPPKRQYSKYLWDSSVEVPLRSKYRFKQRKSLCVPSASQADTDADESSDERSSCASDGEPTTRDVTYSGSGASAEETAHSRSRSCESLEGVSSGDVSSDDVDYDSSDVSGPEPPEPESHEVSSDERTDELDDLLFAGSNLTQAESLLMVMAYSLRHGCSKEATESLVRLVGAHLPSGVTYPASKYAFRHFVTCEQQYKKHFFCIACSEYIGEVTAGEGVSCHKCNLVHTHESLLKSSSFFLVMDLKSQLRGLLESAVHKTDGTSVSYEVADITQSMHYHKLPLSAGDLTLTFNTDGVPLFESSNLSMWPLLVMVNELPYKHRTEKLLLAGLWVGSGKPVMNTFLIPFVKAMNELSTEGVAQDGDGNTHLSKAFPGPCSVDSIARCEIMNMTQFNGANGCAWCEHPGQVIPKGNGFCRVYPPTASTPKPRTHDSFAEHASKARASQQASCGIKGASVLTMLAFFTFGAGFAVDYMHAVCLGFVRSTLFMWMKSHHCRQFRLRNHLEDANRLLLSLTPVWEISRLPRSLSEIKEWKASEWKNWMLFYSPVVLKDYIPERNYKHWLRFVAMMHYLLGPSVHIEQLMRIQKEMLNFLVEHESFYGTEYMTYNSHLLLHLVESVKNWGPLWGYSLFPFESMNGTLGKFVKGTRYPHFQIVQKFCILQALSKLWSTNSVNRKGHHSLESDFKCLMKGYALRKNSAKAGHVLLLGKGERVEGGTVFQKMVLGPFKFCTARLDKSRRKNSYIFTNGLFGCIVQILLPCSPSSSSSGQVKVYVDVLNVKQAVFGSVPLDENLQFVEAEPTSQSCIVDAESLRKCICLSDTQALYLCVVHENEMLESV